MGSPRRIYWDTSCFICFLNKDETSRRLTCEDVLRHAEAGEVEIWISAWVIVEVIRPKKAGNAPLPQWAAAAIAAVPEAKSPLEELWARYQPPSPAQKLTPNQINKIQGMFEWPFLKKAYVDERVARKAVEISRDYNLKPGDAVHAASALLTKCDVIQRWDKDFDRVKVLIASEEPQMISAQQKFDMVSGIGPTPEDFEDVQNQENITPPARFPRSGGGHPEDQTGPEGVKKEPSKAGDSKGIEKADPLIVPGAESAPLAELPASKSPSAELEETSAEKAEENPPSSPSVEGPNR